MEIKSFIEQLKNPEFAEEVAKQLSAILAEVKNLPPNFPESCVGKCYVFTFPSQKELYCQIHQHDYLINGYGYSGFYSYATSDFIINNIIDTTFNDCISWREITPHQFFRALSSREQEFKSIVKKENC